VKRESLGGNTTPDYTALGAAFMIARGLITASAATLAAFFGTACAQRENWAEVNGTRLYYEQSGRGPDVILIHGFSLDTRMWQPQIAALMQHARITRYDVRGFGRSGPATPQHNAVADLLGLMDHLGIQRAHIVGMSMGGAIATDFALTHPERTSSLVLIGATVNGFPHTGFDTRFAPLFEAGARGDLVAAKELWLRDRFVTPVRDSQSIASTVRRIVTDCACQQFADARLLPGASAPPAFERLETIHVPTLAVVGDAEDPGMLAIADAVQLRVPGAKKLVIPNAGHLVNLEQPATLNRALIAFWQARD
jgi:pimeloyl-ACP methyl ester carboxylesterase